jgi:hypothetical protein
MSWPDTGDAPPDDIREVRNYVTALEYGVERLQRVIAAFMIRIRVSVTP